MSIVNSANFIKTLSVLKDSGSSLNTALIEVPTTTGRTAESYKRGGAIEASERLREEVSGAVVWLLGVKVFNKIGDWVGKNVLKLKDIETDIGKDSLRDSIDYIDKATRNKTVGFKFAKVITSAALASGFMGFVLPKINQAITRKSLDEKEAAKAPKLNITMDSFLANSKEKENKKYSNVSFGSAANLANLAAQAAYNLENKAAWRLISTDAGMVVGRAANSRSKTEAFEYTFRDVSSIYFYTFATGHAIYGLNKAFNTTDIHPKAVKGTEKYILDNIGENKISSDEFMEKYVTKAKQMPEIEFNKDGVITVENAIEKLAKKGIEEASDAELINKLRKMSELQPELRGQRVLSIEQFEDVFSKAKISDPEFLKNIINDVTDGRALDPKKFISRNKVQGIRNSIDAHCIWIANYAKKHNGGIVDSNLIKKATTSTLKRTAAFQGAAILFSALGLGVLIPRTQMFLSKTIFGEKTFEEIANGK